MLLVKYYKKFTNFSRTWRSKAFLPLLKILAAFKITADGITIFRLLFLLPVIYYFSQANLGGALIFYILFWFFDLLDGALARYLGQANDKGRFLDTLVDNFGYAVLIISMIFVQGAWPWLLASNILLEVTVQILAIMKNNRQLKSDWLIKAEGNLPYFKTISHLVLLAFYFGFDYLNFSYLLLNFVLLCYCASYFLQIKNNH